MVSGSILQQKLEEYHGCLTKKLWQKCSKMLKKTKKGENDESRKMSKNVEKSKKVSNVEKRSEMVKKC